MASSQPQVEAGVALEAAEESKIEVDPIVEEEVATPTEETEVVVHEDDDEEEVEEVEVESEVKEEGIASTLPIVENEEDEGDPSFDDDGEEVCPTT